MKPEIGDKVLVRDYLGEYEGIVYRLPDVSSDYYYVGRSNGTTTYPALDKITVLFRPKYHYINQNPFKVGDLVLSHTGERCLVVGLKDDRAWNYQVSRLAHDGALMFAREQDLVLVHAAGHPEEKVSVQEVEPEGWYGYPEAPAVPAFTEADDDVLPF